MRRKKWRANETAARKTGAKRLLAALLAMASPAALWAQTDGAALSPTGFLLRKETTLLAPNPAPEWRAPSGQTLPGPIVIQPQAPMPFFCRIEHRMGQQMALPLKFRLGDVPYVDRLEGKRRWYE